MISGYLIEARTGCSCCSSENHYRGLYRSQEDAERRVAYYRHPDSQFWPLGSQYARRGRYSVQGVQLEPISKGRYILDDDLVLDSLNWIEVKEDGSVENNDSEEFDDKSYT